jgi:hypothetical protein
MTKIMAITPAINNVPPPPETELIADVVALIEVVWGISIANSCFKKPEKAEYPINKKYIDIKIQQ